MTRLRILTLIIVIVMVLSSCSSGSGGSGGGSGNAKILISFSNTDGFLNVMKETMEDYVNSNGIQYTLLDAQGNVEQQFDQLRDHVDDGYDAVVLNLVDSDTALQVTRMFGDTPIIFFNTMVDEKHLEPGLRLYVGSDENDSGGFQGEYLLKYFSGRSAINVVLFRGEPVHRAAYMRTEAVKKALDDGGMDVTYVFEDTANWSRAQAEELFNTVLKTGKSYDAVICNNDEMAIGVINSMIANGIDPSSVPILGVDATPDGCAEIEAGNMAFTVYQSASGQGIKAVEAAVILGSGGSLEGFEYLSEDGNYIWVPFERVDKSNVASYK